MKKIFKVLLLVIFIAWLSACETNKYPTVVEEFDAQINLPTTTSADLKILIPGGNQNETTMIEKAIEGFNLIYPNIKISMSYLAVNSYENTVRNQALAGTLPDIVWTNSPDFYFLIDKNIALPLDKYFELSEEAGVFNLEEDFHKEFFDMGSLNGKRYVIPRSADSVVTFYNKAILTEAGIDLELIQNGWTWDTFMTIAKQVRTYFDANGKSDRFILDANLQSWLSVSYPLLRSFGADVANPEGELIIDSAETREAITMVRNLVTDRIIVGTGVTSGSSFEAGTSPFLFQSAAVSLFANRRALEGNIDIVSFPLIGDAPKIGSGIAGYTINAQTIYKNESWAFLNYLMSYDGQQNLALGGLNLPSIRKDLEDYTAANWGAGYTDFNLGAYLYGKDYKIAIEFLQYFDPKYKSDLDLAFKDLFNNAANIDKTIEESITTVLRDMNDALGN